MEDVEEGQQPCPDDVQVPENGPVVDSAQVLVESELPTDNQVSTDSQVADNSQGEKTPTECVEETTGPPEVYLPIELVRDLPGDITEDVPHEQPEVELLTPVVSPVESEAEESRIKRKHVSRTRRSHPLDMESAKIGFVGAGKIAECIIEGLINYGDVGPHQIYASAPSNRHTERLRCLGCNVTRRNIDIFGKFDCDIIFICFHGYVIKQCYERGGKIPHPFTTNYIPNMLHPVYILSMVSGVTLQQVRDCLLNPEHPHKYLVEMHRVVMSPSCALGLGICAIDVDPHSEELSAPVRTLLSSIARLHHVQESQMDAVCTLMGSGLPIAYYTINALAEGAYKLGLYWDVALKLAAQTSLCGAQCIMESGLDAIELFDTVASPDGSAVYGVHVLNKADVSSKITTAIEAVHQKTAELAKLEVPASRHTDSCANATLEDVSNVPNSTTAVDSVT